MDNKRNEDIIKRTKNKNCIGQKFEIQNQSDSAC
jgi:hypothetical protein